MELLPETKLTGIDVSRELLMQLAVLKKLQEEVLNEDSGVPANQRAQVANSVGQVIAKIAKMQTEQYSSERFKRIEMNLIELLNRSPNLDVEEFLVQYAALNA